jgi:hypothetical protein
MPVEALIAANHLVYPYALQAGQTLYIPRRGAPAPGRAMSSSPATR